MKKNCDMLLGAFVAGILNPFIMEIPVFSHMGVQRLTLYFVMALVFNEIAKQSH